MTPPPTERQQRRNQPLSLLAFNRNECSLSAGTGARNRRITHLAVVVAELNPVLRGWGAYYRYGNSSRKFNTVDSYVHERLAKLASVKHGISGRNWTTRFTYGWLSDLGIYRLTGTVATGLRMPDGERCRRAGCGVNRMPGSIGGRWRGCPSLRKRNEGRESVSPAPGASDDRSDQRPTSPRGISGHHGHLWTTPSTLPRGTVRRWSWCTACWWW